MRHNDAVITSHLRLPPGPVDLTRIDSGGTPGFDGDKAEGKAALLGLGDELSDLQERLFAEGRSGGARSVLVILQGMDTSGKSGTIKSVFSETTPLGMEVKAFNAFFCTKIVIF